jgi:hypothetical protein
MLRNLPLRVSVGVAGLAGLALASTLALCGGSAAGARVDPIVGTWQGAGGTVVITAAYPAFQGKTHSTVTFGSCSSPPGDLVWSIEPAGDFGEPPGHYRGEQVVGSGVYYGNSCYFNAVFSVSGNTLTVATTETADGKESPAGTYTFTRVGASTEATHWSWSFSLAAVPVESADRITTLAGTLTHARGTLTVGQRPDGEIPFPSLGESFPAYRGRHSSHPAVVFNDLYLHIRNVRTLLHVLGARTLVPDARGYRIVVLDVVVRFSDVHSCRVGSRGGISLVQGPQPTESSVYFHFCHIDRTYEEGKPDASDKVTVAVTPTS